VRSLTRFGRATSLGSAASVGVLATTVVLAGRVLGPNFGLADQEDP
jgi:hypothetical protein